MNFSEALTHLNSGYTLTRTGWNGKGQWVCVQDPDENSFMSVPYLYLSNAQSQRVPWLPSQGDLFAKDWELYAGVQN